MTGTFVSKRNLEFLLYEVFDVLSLMQHELYQSHNKEMFDMLIDTSLSIANDHFLPALIEMDREPPQFADGHVTVHPSVRTVMRQMGGNGWIGATFPESVGGFDLPLMISNSCNFIFAAANYSTSAYPLLTTGAAGLILAFGDQGLIDAYVPKMLQGEWQGTMAMTEPEVGSSLADMQTTATPTPEGFYKLKGRKIFISAGDHDGVDNIVNLMLAKIEGAPPGIRGISLFVVPQKRIGEGGELVPNDVTTAELYHKMGYKGTPIVALSLGDDDDCRGYLVGEPHAGLSYMFQMMNEARIGVGMGAAAIASAAYHAALQYAQERYQGRKPTNKDPLTAPIPIIEHADIKRMLLFQRAIVEGSLSLLTQCSRYADLHKCLPDGEERESAALLLDLLTPIAKTYPSEMGIQSTSQSVQVLGGYGYVDDFPVEQWYREARVHPIHEGTTGIQGMDLLGRKIRMQEGKALKLFVGQIMDAIETAQQSEALAGYAGQLGGAVETLDRVTRHLFGVAASDGPEHYLANATLYLELFGIITVGWQWLLQGIAADLALQGKLSESEADFYMGKLFTLRYFFGYELPKINGLATTLTQSDGVTVEMEGRYF
jgi:butyryl-CoA dehydrogenase